MDEPNINPQLASTPLLKRLYADAQTAGFDELACTEILGHARGWLRNPNRDTWVERHPELHTLLRDMSNPTAWANDWLKQNDPYPTVGFGGGW